MLYGVIMLLCSIYHSRTVFNFLWRDDRMVRALVGPCGQQLGQNTGTFTEQKTINPSLESELMP